MKIKKLLPVCASSYYQVLISELNKDFKANRKNKKQKLIEGISYDKCLKLSKGDVQYKVTIEKLTENIDYQVRMNFQSYSQIISHHIKQIDDGVISVTYEEKIENCNLLNQCFMMIRGRFMRMKILQFINYLYQEAQALEDAKES